MTTSSLHSGSVIAGLALLAGAMASPGSAEAAKYRNRDRGSLGRPLAGSAWQALGFARRPLRVGDRWEMAWSQRRRAGVVKRALGQTERAQAEHAFGAPVLVRYEVIRSRRVPLGTQSRMLSTVRMTWAARHAGEATTHAEVTLDQYLNPVSRRVYTSDLPYGRRQDLDTRAVLRSVGPFPFFIGDIERTPARPAQPPSLTPALRGVRGLAGAALLQVPVSVRGSLVHSYWSPGLPAPSFVVGRNIHGVLLRASVAR